MSQKKRVRRIKPVTLQQAQAAGLWHGVALIETIDAQYNPTVARLRGGGWKKMRTGD